MIFCAKKCAISGLCTSASGSRTQTACNQVHSSAIVISAGCFRLRSGLLRRTGRRFVTTAEVTHPEGPPAMVALTIRTMRPDDISIAVDWAAAEGWNPGLADAL